MHEQSIAKHIIKAAQEHGDVKAITVECGNLGHLPAHEMKEVLEKMTDWKIEILTKKAEIACPACQFTGEPKILQQLHDHNIFACPKCEHMFPQILSGDQIVLKSVEVSDNE